MDVYHDAVQTVAYSDRTFLIDKGAHISNPLPLLGAFHPQLTSYYLWVDTVQVQ